MRLRRGHKPDVEEQKHRRKSVDCRKPSPRKEAGKRNPIVIYMFSGSAQGHPSTYGKGRWHERQSLQEPRDQYMNEGKAALINRHGHGRCIEQATGKS